MEAFQVRHMEGRLIEECLLEDRPIDESVIEDLSIE
jgi:hypothetical protein